MSGREASLTPQDDESKIKTQTTKDLLAKVEREREKSDVEKDSKSSEKLSNSPVDSKKVRSFASYMSNVEQRKQELAKQELKQQREKEQELLREQQQKEQLEKEQLDKEVQEKEQQEKEQEEKEQEEIQRQELAVEESNTSFKHEEVKDVSQETTEKLSFQTDNEKSFETKPDESNSNDAAEDDQSQNQSSVKVEEKEAALPTESTNVETKPSSKDSSTLSPLSSSSSDLSALPSAKSVSRQSTHIDIPDVIPEADNSDTSRLQSEDPQASTNNLADEDSDAETVHSGSPTKPRRGRLVRKSELDNNHSTSKSQVRKVEFENDASDSDGFTKKKNHHPNHQQHSRGVSRSISPTRAQPKKRTGRDSGGRLKLQRACDKGRFEEAKKLIEEGADVNDQDYAGNSALHEAALKGYTDIVELLLENGAHVDLQSGPDDLDTPLIDAAANGHKETVELLLKYGADPRVQNAHGQNALDSLDIDDQDTPYLKEALKKATLKLRTKSRETSTTSNNNSDYEYSSFDEDHTRSRSLQRQALGRRHQHTRNDLLWMDFTTRGGREEVYTKASEGDVQFVGAYLENGGKPDIEALALAARYGHTDVVNLFLAFGAKVDEPNSKGTTPLMATVGRGHLETVKLLLQAGADPTKHSKNGKTSLEFAIDSLIADDEEIRLLREAAQNFGVGKYPDETISNANDASSSELKLKKRKVSIKDDHHDDASPETKKKKVVNLESSSKPTDIKVKTEFKPKITESKPKSETKRVVSSGSLNTVVQRKVSDVQQQLPQLPMETEEEKLARLQKEKEEQKLREKYEAERIAKLKAREQQFLDSIESEEKRKQQELQKFTQLEEERKQIEKQKQQERAKEEEERKLLMSQNEETVKRQKIRESYPYGLQVALFNNNNTPDLIAKYLPLLHFKRPDGFDYVVDLQVILISGFENFNSKYGALYETGNQITSDEKAKLYSYLYPILGNFTPRSISKQIEDYREEYRKFLRLEIYWIKYESVLKTFENDFAHLKPSIENSSLEVDFEEAKPVDFSNFNTFKHPEPNSRKTSSVLPSASSIATKLPISWRGRPAALKVLSKTKKLW